MATAIRSIDGQTSDRRLPPMAGGRLGDGQWRLRRGPTHTNARAHTHTHKGRGPTGTTGCLPWLRWELEASRFRIKASCICFISNRLPWL